MEEIGDIGKKINFPYNWPPFTMIGIFERFWKRTACFFGFHDWDEDSSSTAGYEYEVYRFCNRCKRMERMYMGDWVPVRKVKDRRIQA